MSQVGPIRNIIKRCMPEKFQQSITFGTADELRKKREKDFLALTPDERFERFLLMMQESYIMFGKKSITPPDNFVIEKDSSD